MGRLREFFRDRENRNVVRYYIDCFEKIVMYTVGSILFLAFLLLFIHVFVAFVILLVDVPIQTLMFVAIIWFIINTI